MSRTKSYISLAIIIAVILVLLCGCDKSSTEIKINNAQQNGNYYRIVVSHDTSIFRFSDYVETDKGATWTVSTDYEGKNTIPSKTCPIEIGDTTFAINVSDKGSNTVQYYLTIHRLNEYTVEFFFDNGKEPSYQRVEEGALLRKPSDPSREGYRFVGWNYDFSNPISSSTVITALWEPIPCKGIVNYYFENLKGQYELSSFDELDLVHDELRSIVPAEVPGFVPSSYKIEYKADATTENVIDIYYKRVSNSISFHLDGRTGETKNYHLKYKEPFPEELLCLERVGYSFKGWSDKETLESIVEHKIYDGMTTDYYAVWEAESFVAQFDPGQGTLDKTSMTVLYGSTVKFPIPKRSGYSFLGWVVDGKLITSSEMTWDYLTGKTFSAKWALTCSYTIRTIVENLDGSFTKELQESYSAYDGEVISISPTKRTGYTVSDMLEKTVKYGESNTIEIRYQLKRYSVTLHPNNGSMARKVELKYGEVLPDAERTGYTFGGWSKDVNITDAPKTVSANDALASDYYAYWEEETETHLFEYEMTTVEVDGNTYQGWFITRFNMDSFKVNVIIPAYINDIPVVCVDMWGIGNRRLVVLADTTKYITTRGVDYFEKGYYGRSCIYLNEGLVAIDKGALTFGHFYICLLIGPLPSTLRILGLKDDRRSPLPSAVYMAYSTDKCVADVYLPDSIREVGFLACYYYYKERKARWYIDDDYNVKDHPGYNYEQYKSKAELDIEEEMGFSIDKDMLKWLLGKRGITE